jgi:hypothetical protein
MYGFDKLKIGSVTIFNENFYLVPANANNTVSTLVVLPARSDIVSHCDLDLVIELVRVLLSEKRHDMILR